MNVAQEIKTALGSLVSQRLFPNRFPQETTPTWPAIRFTVINRAADITIDGTDDGESDDIRVQLDIVATSYEAARTLRNQVVASIQAMSTPNARVGEQETYDTDTKTHRVILEVMFMPSSAPA